MPCRTYDDGDVIRDQNVTIGNLREMLCEACNLIKDNDTDHLMSANLRAWWNQHQAEDRRRQNAEDEKKKLREIANGALRNLTSEQLEALRVHHGLNLKKG